MNKMKEFLTEIKNEDQDRNPKSAEYFCKTCRVISGEEYIEVIDEFEKNIPYSQNKKLYFPRQKRRIEKRFKETGIVFTRNSSLYLVHLKYMNKDFEEGDHDCGVYNT